MTLNLSSILHQYEEDTQTETLDSKLEELDSLFKQTHIQPQYKLSDKNVHKVEYLLKEKTMSGRKWYLVKWENQDETTWEPIENISRYTLQSYQLNQEAKQHNKHISKPQYTAHLYLRTSKPRINDGQVSIDVQKHDMMTYCYQNNIAIKNITSDEGTSARNMKNLEGLNFILDKIQPNDILMVWDISRFSRNALQALHLLEELNNKNISTYFLQEDITYEGAMHKHYVRQALSTSQLHSDTISEKVKSAIEYKKSKGNYIGSAKYGYKAKKIKGVRKLVKSKKEQNNIKLIKNLCNHIKEVHDLDNVSNYYKEIATLLNNKGIKFRGRPFTKNNVSLLTKR